MPVRTACNRDCPDACGILATVEDGKVVRLQGDPEHPVTQGFLCYRTSRFLDRQYDPDRLTTPLIRGRDGFKPIGWSSALDLIAEKMLRIKSESGAAAILHYRSGGSLGLMKHVTEYFFESFGPVTIKSGDICSGAGEAAQETDFGVSDSHDLHDLLKSRTIVLWGKNPYVSNVHLLPVLKQAREAGARIAQIDPVRHRGADLAEVYLQPRPGGDAALSLAVARWLFDHGRDDPAAAEYCDHLDAYRALTGRRSFEAWAELSGCDPVQVAQVAELYADGPSALLVGWGLQRREHGSATVRLLDALGAVSGNLGIPGGGVSFYFQRRGPFDLSFVRGIPAAPRTIPEPLLGPGILAAEDPVIRMVWVTAGNPVAMLPDSARVAKALRTREMTVVVDSHMTDSAREAHLVLPTTTMLEDDDLLGAFGHHWLARVRPVVDAPPGVRTDYEISRELARRLKLGAEFERDAADWQRVLLSRVEGHGVTAERLAQGAVRRPETPEVLFADRKFFTGNGKVNLIHDAAVEPPAPPSDRPLLLMAVSTEKSQASQWPAQTQQGPADAIVHPDAANGCREDEVARLESEVGAIEVRVRFDDRQRKDVVLMQKGGWFRKGRCANALIPAATTDAGGGARYYDTPVRLVPVH